MTYIIVIALITALSFLSYSKDWDISLTFLLQPLTFILIDTILLYVLMRFLSREKYVLQQRVLTYFKGWNNILLVIAIFIGSMNIITAIVDLFLHYIVFIFIRPIPVDDATNGVEEFFNKYPERAGHKFYKNVDEIKKDYDPLKKEMEVEIPSMEVEVKNAHREKMNKIKDIAIPIFIIVIAVLGIFFQIVDQLKTFNRGTYHHFTAQINDTKLTLYYDQKYERVVIPVILTLRGQNDSSEVTLVNLDDIKVDLPKSEEYSFNFKEYICTDTKDKNVKTKCSHLNMNTIKEKKLAPTDMEISFINSDYKYDSITDLLNTGKKVYDGKYVEDITKYLDETGIYVFTLENSDDHITNKIIIVIEIVDDYENVDN